MHAHKVEGTGAVSAIAGDCREHLIEAVELLLREPPEDFPSFETWQKRRNVPDPWHRARFISRPFPSSRMERP